MRGGSLRELEGWLGDAGPIRNIHARAKQHLHRGQGDLSLDELEKKRRWLERCLRARRLLENNGHPDEPKARKGPRRRSMGIGPPRAPEPHS